MAPRVVISVAVSKEYNTGYGPAKSIYMDRIRPRQPMRHPHSQLMRRPRRPCSAHATHAAHAARAPPVLVTTSFDRDAGRGSREIASPT